MCWSIELVVARREIQTHFAPRLAVVPIEQKEVNEPKTGPVVELNSRGRCRAGNINRNEAML